MENLPAKLSQDEDGGTQGEVGLVTRTATRLKKPSLYQVLLLNDDYTPMDYVITVLRTFFDKDHAEATRLMLQVHHDGKAAVGIYTHEIAETKVALVVEDARKHGYPLQCTMEKI